MSDTFRFTTRRSFLIGTAALTLGLGKPVSAKQDRTDAPPARLAELERKMGGRLGLSALNTANGQRIDFRADERFPVCSTFKLILAGAILKHSVQDAALLQKIIHYSTGDLVAWSPLTEKHLADGMSIAALCAAALQYSDNTAANLLMKELGGPEAVTAYAHSIGNKHFRLDRWETELNSAIPGDPRDTATPASMADSLRMLTLGDALPSAQRTQLNEWMLGNTTGAKRIQAGVPADWKVGDKTGTGDYGSANDIGIVWPPGKKPMVLAIYHTHNDAKATANNEIIAAAARIVVEAFHG
ncbi:MAG TPA: class A beta-lactamase [Rhodocyclaceae bacterium]|nr:class A beta-lactamase [Rhodocyclaceae bacterium]